jgi:uncharacterized membrane protein/predicted DsbA family dithiol-disulfide isomerase
MTSSRTNSRLPVVIAALGLLLSLALEVVHYRAYTAPSATSFCTVGEKLDCASVALSRYSVAFGIPMPYWGIAGFMALLAAAWLRSRWLLPLSAVAAIATTVLLGIELLSLHTICLLCEGVHLTSVALLVVAWRHRAELSAPYGERDNLLLVLGAPVGLLVALALFLPPYWGAFGWKGDVPFAQGKTAEGYPWIGAEQPSLIVHEFTDYSCPHCKIASSHTLKALAAHSKKLRVVRRQYARMTCPPGVPSSCQLARMAYCAQEQGKFWPTDRWLFEHATARSEVDVAVAARDIGLDESQLRTCLTRSDTYARADADAKAALKKHIIETPTYIVGDKKISAEQVQKLISDL